ncbi:MAG TPA: hypothetical protein VMF69_03820 [Gemmataceae bacterium]|nr:hypothetical protein [Gemmataceae bacterium]
MIASFLDSLRNQQPAFNAILDVCQASTMPVFADLCWGDTFDLNAAFRDPGIQLDAQERRLVLMRVNNEIRYYVGPNDPFADDYPQEIGTLPTEADALSFAYEYLVKRLPLSEIKVKRVVRSRTS